MSQINWVEICVLYFPMILVGVLCYVKRPKGGAVGALVMSFLWSFTSIYVCNQIAFSFAWWSYSGASAEYRSVPLSVWIGWSVAWGLAAPLISLRLPLLFVGAFVLDLILMPVLQPLLVLNSSWLWGEVLSVGIILGPSVCLYRWTIERSFLHLRVIFQALIFFFLVGFLGSSRKCVFL